MATMTEKNSARLMIAKLERQLGAIYDEQESLKKFKKGGKVKSPKMIGGGMFTGLTDMVSNVTEPGAGMLSGLGAGNFLSQMGSSLGFKAPPLQDVTSSSERNQNLSDQINKPDWEQAAQFLPMGYNAVKGLLPADTLKASDYQNRYKKNPYMGQAMGALSESRNVDTSAQMAQTTVGENIARRNQTRLGSASGGAQFARSQVISAEGTRQRGNITSGAINQDLQNEIGRRRDVSGAYNQFGQQQLQLGQQEAAINLGVKDMNDRNKAARNAFLGQSMEDASKYSQTQQLMGNQKEHDAMLAKIYPDMFGTSQFQPELMALLQQIRQKGGLN